MTSVKIFPCLPPVHWLVTDCLVCIAEIRYFCRSLGHFEDLRVKFLQAFDIVTSWMTPIGRPACRRPQSRSRTCWKGKHIPPGLVNASDQEVVTFWGIKTQGYLCNYTSGWTDGCNLPAVAKCLLISKKIIDWKAEEIKLRCGEQQNSQRIHFIPAGRFSHHLALLFCFCLD